MKLYTEEEVIKAIDLARLQGSEPYLVKYREEEILNMITPIELPSEEDIVDKALEIQWSNTLFQDGAKWMRDKILGGNK